jgi:hypothetical protein
MLDVARTGASTERDGVDRFLAASAAFSSARIDASSSAARASSASVRVSGRGRGDGVPYAAAGRRCLALQRRSLSGSRGAASGSLGHDLVTGLQRWIGRRAMVWAADGRG